MPSEKAVYFQKSRSSKWVRLCTDGEKFRLNFIAPKNVKMGLKF